MSWSWCAATAAATHVALRSPWPAARRPARGRGQIFLRQIPVSAPRFAAVIGALVVVFVISLLRPAAAESASNGGRMDVRTHWAQGHSRGVVVHVVQTTATLAQRMKRLPDIRMVRGRVRAPRVVQVRDGIRYQTITGFGATLTDSSAWLIHNELSATTGNKLMRRLFSSNGLHLNFIRLPMGASDFTAAEQPYSYDDMPPGESDPTLGHFSIAHDLPYIIPTLHQALSNDPALVVLANPWSAPAWMKANQATGNFLYGGTLLPGDYAPFASYFVKYLQAYRSYGVPVDAVTPQNEPHVGEDPGMEFSEPDEATFITRDLRPALTAAGLRTQVFGLDLSWDKLSYAMALATGSTSGDLQGISWHCYFGSPEAMTQLHSHLPQLIQLVNECSPEIRPFSTAQVLIGSLRNWATVVALWNLALDPRGGPVQPPGRRCPGCRGLVTIDENTHRARPGPTYYELGQVSRFVAPGAVRIGSNTFVTDGTDAANFYQPTVGLDDVAFINPNGQKSLVTYNSSPGPVRFAVSWHGREFLYRQPAGATATFTWK